MQYFYSLSKELAETLDVDTTIRDLAADDGITPDTIREVPAESVSIDAPGRRNYRWFLVTP